MVRRFKSNVWSGFALAPVLAATAACSSPGGAHEGTSDGSSSTSSPRELCDEPSVTIEVHEGRPGTPAALRRATTIDPPLRVQLDGPIEDLRSIRLEVNAPADPVVVVLCYEPDTSDPTILHLRGAAADARRCEGSLSPSPPKIDAGSIRVVSEVDKLTSGSRRDESDSGSPPARRATFDLLPLDCSDGVAEQEPSATPDARVGRASAGAEGAAGALGALPDPQAMTSAESGTSSSGDDGQGEGDGGDTGGAGGCVAPAPEDAAPPVDPTVTTSFHASVRFLYEEDPRVQVDVEPSTIVPSRASRVSGTVLDELGTALGCAEVRVVGHPEYGSTMTRADGRFDMVVNAGASLVLEFNHVGLMAAHRRWRPRANEATRLLPVKLISTDAEWTEIAFGATATDVQTHVATEIIDEDGARQAALVFQPQTQANLRMPNGDLVPAAALTVRATEFTVGETGPAAMPAELPPGTMYTYALEFTADEADAAGASTVVFDPPAALYLENFLGAEVGTVLPSGSYSRSAARWNTEPNGRVIEILSIVDGVAQLDLEGEGLVATPAELAGAGITPVELEALASLYPITPQQITRTPVLHFTEPLDCNFAGRPPEDSTEPPEDGVEPNDDEDCNAQRAGSIIECEDQVLGQRIEVPGTPFSLNYRTSRTPGAPNRSLRINLAGEEVPESLRRARLEVAVGDRVFEQDFEDVAPNDTYTFTWDGLDAHGRQPQGGQPTRVCLTYDYPAEYVGRATAVNEDVFGDWAQDGVAVAGRDFAEIGLSRCYSRGPTAGAANAGTINKANMIRLGGLDARTSAAGLGGWTLSVHHTLSLETGTLYLGDGEQRDLGDGQRAVVARVAGNGTTTGNLTGASAVGARVSYPTAIAVGPDGSLYVATIGNGVSGQGTGARVRRVTPEGAIEAFAGNGQSGFLGDGDQADGRS